MEDFKIPSLHFMNGFKSDCYGHKCNIEKLKEINSQIVNCFYDEQKNFCKLCYSLKELRDLFYSDESYYNAFETVDKRFPFERFVNEVYGLDLRYVEKCISCLRFMEVGAGADLVKLKFNFELFSKSKLFELLSVSMEQLEKDILSHRLYPEMTKLQIRDYVKEIKGNKKSDNKVYEEPENLEPTTDEELSALVERSFDIKNKYDFEYFRQRSKTELIDIAFTCYQKYYELKDKKTNK